jgi:hypothetical protein
MDVFRLGFRSIVGITMPGTIVVLSVVYGLWVLEMLPAQVYEAQFKIDSGAALLATVIFFLVSYALGNVLSLRASGHADRLAAQLIPAWQIPGEHIAPDTFRTEVGRLSSWRSARDWLLDPNAARDKLIAESSEGVALERLLDPNVFRVRMPKFSSWSEARRWIVDNDGKEETLLPTDWDAAKEFILDNRRNWFKSWNCDSLWATDRFPYPCWSLVRIARYCPPGVIEFYWDYVKPALAQINHSPDFFNHCKMAVYRGNGNAQDLLAAEIQESEAKVRYFAGAFNAFVISAAFLAGSTFLLAARNSAELRLPGWLSGEISGSLVLALCVLTSCAVVMISGRASGKKAEVASGEDWRREPASSLRSVARRFLEHIPWSFLAVGIISFISIICALSLTAHGYRGLEPRGVAVLSFAEFLLAYGIICQGRLRNLRLAEVANAMDAFYLTCGKKDHDHR